MACKGSGVANNPRRVILFSIIEMSLTPFMVPRGIRQARPIFFEV